ncbi:hypothetical protein [Arthrobacter roseus]|uniref:hypothetical protein n=1 Tax=Arthrobacter roseus TaxID=136274 RepID=UPI0019628F49|nr:hypothetical protein [Arthrobacter roseus]MBM7849622.1 hypothetical protein [Arthrobacter roseus]
MASLPAGVVRLLHQRQRVPGLFLPRGKSSRQIDDGRSLSFLGGLAEGAETVLVHSLWLLFPAAAWHIASVSAFLVLVSATQRIVAGYRLLR